METRRLGFLSGFLVSYLCKYGNLIQYLSEKRLRHLYTCETKILKRMNLTRSVLLVITQVSRCRLFVTSNSILQFRSSSGTLRCSTTNDRMARRCIRSSIIPKCDTSRQIFENSAWKRYQTLAKVKRFPVNSFPRASPARGGASDLSTAQL